MIIQSEASECGLACLAIVLAQHGRPTSLTELRRRFPASLRGATLQHLVGHADALGFAPRPLRLELDQIPKLEVPCILHWDLNHFVVLKSVASGRLVILDPAVGERRLDFSEASRHFTGFALELTPTGRHQEIERGQPWTLATVTGQVQGWKRSVAQIICLAITLELFSVATPLLMQLVVDEAIASLDAELLFVILFGFSLLLIAQILFAAARSWLLLILDQQWALQWSGNVFRHLVRLPVDFYEKRHLGDIASRFGSIQAIHHTLTLTALESMIDGVMAVIASIMMFIYSPLLTAVVCLAVSIYGVLRWLVYGPYRTVAAERLAIESKERSHFLESLRAIVPLKLFNREPERVARWRNLIVETQNRDASSQKMLIAFTAANSLIFGIENLLVIWIGAQLVMHAAPSTGPVFTVGMLIAFINYKSQFCSRISALVDYTVELKMLSLHADRLADIAMAVPEPLDEIQRDGRDLDPCVELRSVGFRYGANEPWIIRNANLEIRSGESLAIVGPSGCGKTTLLKILLGLLQPEEGEVRYGGVPIRKLGLRSFREMVGTVMQDDLLLSGSLADNISFFDEVIDEGRIHSCAQLAAIHDDIVKMPMGYQTLVGDMGSSLSGGQRQRVLLARALYKMPRVLALDEATSHLDVMSERAVTQSLGRLQLTRIVVAHRPETISGAGRVVQLNNGRLSEVRSVV